jgi:hypothetical protein
VCVCVLGDDLRFIVVRTTVPIPALPNLASTADLVTSLQLCSLHNMINWVCKHLQALAADAGTEFVASVNRGLDLWCGKYYYMW